MEISWNFVSRKKVGTLPNLCQFSSIFDILRDFTFKFCSVYADCRRLREIVTHFSQIVQDCIRLVLVLATHSLRLIIHVFCGVPGHPVGPAGTGRHLLYTSGTIISLFCRVPGHPVGPAGTGRHLLYTSGTIISLFCRVPGHPVGPAGTGRRPGGSAERLHHAV